MNLAISKAQPLTTLSWHILLEQQADGQVVAWVAELPDCRVVAGSREDAIAQLEPLVEKRMAGIEAVEFHLPTQAIPQPHPLDDVPSIDKDDPAFIEFMATLRADRELDDDNPAYTINW
jgi:predicted RNase H-like HicB family nuclease